MIVCKDIEWYYPTVDLVNSNKIDTMIFTTEWLDNFPYYLPHATCASWAKGLQVFTYLFVTLAFYESIMKLVRRSMQEICIKKFIDQLVGIKPSQSSANSHTQPQFRIRNIYN